MPTSTEVQQIIATYAKAWTTRDPELIVTLFTPDAIYHERVLEDAHKGRAAIRQYWIDKVVGEQQNIVFKLLNTYQDGNTVIVEWEAEFDDISRDQHVHMREVAILEFEGNLIRSLREYWQSERTPRQNG